MITKKKKERERMNVFFVSFDWSRWEGGAQGGNNKGGGGGGWEGELAALFRWAQTRHQQRKRKRDAQIERNGALISLASFKLLADLNWTDDGIESGPSSIFYRWLDSIDIEDRRVFPPPHTPPPTLLPPPRWSCIELVETGSLVASAAIIIGNDSD